TLYDQGLFASERPALPTVSVGNLTVGGTGKTPFAAWLALELARASRPAIALRGYGGDEIAVHRLLNPSIPVLANANRGAAIHEAKAPGCDVRGLDDAFQPRGLDRTADLLLISAEPAMAL